MKKNRNRSSEWAQFIEKYVSSNAYWYTPKGRSVRKIDEIRLLLQSLERYEGDVWHQIQSEYLENLNALNLFHARVEEQSDNDANAMARMVKKVFDTLGFAWINASDIVTITPAGKAFLNEENPNAVLEKQLWKYQFWNPLVGGSTHESIHIHPHAFLIEVLLHFTRGITTNEYILFISRSSSSGDLDSVIEMIEKWRSIEDSEREQIVSRLKNHYIEADPGRRSIYETVKLNQPYALAFHEMGSYINRFLSHQVDEISLRIKPSRKYDVEYLLRNFKNQNIFIEFQSQKDWIAYYGDVEKRPDYVTALDYYEDVSDIERAVGVYSRIASGNEDLVDDYKELRISEKNIEDMLEKNLNLIEEGLRLVEGGRQYQTIIGRIDLLAVDKNGNFVVIELKKGRPADEVYGQISRYIGWIRMELATDKQKVRGIIVARDFDKKLDYAIKSHPRPIVEFFHCNPQLNIRKKE